MVKTYKEFLGENDYLNKIVKDIENIDMFKDLRDTFKDKKTKDFFNNELLKSRSQQHENLLKLSQQHKKLNNDR